MLEGLAGLLIGFLTIAFVNLVRGERWIYSALLITLPGIYVFFALHAGEHAVGMKELFVGIPFVLGGLICAVFSIRKSAVLVGLLWLLHGSYDLAHGRLFANPAVPDWYPIFCAAVDAVVGLYLLWLSQRLRNSDLSEA